MPTTDAAPDSFANLLLQQQAVQHVERMAEARELRGTLTGRFDRLDIGQTDLRQKLTALDAVASVAVEQRGVMGGRFDRLDAGQLVLREQIVAVAAVVPTKFERQTILASVVAVLILLILLLATSRGVDTGAAVDGVRALTGQGSPVAPAVVSLPEPATDLPEPLAPPESLYAPAVNGPAILP